MSISSYFLLFQWHNRNVCNLAHSSPVIGGSVGRGVVVVVACVVVSVATVLAVAQHTVDAISCRKQLKA